MPLNPELFVTTSERSGEDRDSPLVKNLREQFGKERQRALDRAKRKSQPLSEELAACSGELQVAYEEYFREFGIGNISWPEYVFYTEKDINGEVETWGVGTTGGYFSSGLIVVRGYLGHSVEKLLKVAEINHHQLKRFREFAAASTLSHELFHASSPMVIAREEKPRLGLVRRFLGDPTVNVRWEKLGVSYNRSKHRGWGESVEEGLAMKLQDRMLGEVLGKHYLAESVFYLKARNLMAEAIKNTNLSIPLESIAPLAYLGLDRVAESYSKSVKLVNFLEQEMPDFERLVMRARILHETLPLARAIEKRFGRGSYLEILMAREENAGVVLKRLQSPRA